MHRLSEKKNEKKVSKENQKESQVLSLSCPIIAYGTGRDKDKTGQFKISVPFNNIMDFLIVEEFNKFWYLFGVNEKLFPHRRSCTLRLWMEMPREKRAAIIAELEKNGAPANRNPYFYVQDFVRPPTLKMTYSEYYRKYGTTEERDGWKMANPTGQQVIYVKTIL